MTLKNKLLALAATALCVAVPMTQAHAQGFPNKAVRIVVPYATGGGSDILARQIGAGLQPVWGQGVVVDNKAGASGNIGSQEVVHAWRNPKHSFNQNFIKHKVGLLNLATEL